MTKMSWFSKSSKTTTTMVGLGLLVALLFAPIFTSGQASLPTVNIYGNSIDPGVAYAIPEPSGNNAVWQATCDRTPTGISTPKKTGGNGFTIKISGEPEKYVPGEGYSVTLQSYNRLSYTEQKFTGFVLVVEPLNKIRSDESGFTQQVGNFELYGDALVKFSDSCANAITQTSHIPKSSIQAMWRAPPVGSGCVVFKASVVEHKDEWRMDDDDLTKVLCEEEQESQDKQPDILDECCACDEAKYEMTFEGLWSRHTHPKDFPHGTLTHFSDIIGASHTGDFRIWEYNQLASEGVKSVAEMGSTRKLESELKAESEKIRTIIKARGLFFPNVTSKTFAVFRVDRQHHVMSLLSMLGPSPDWAVGVSALELCLKNCSWTTEKVMNLYPWDAGTDSGISYISPNQKTEIPEKIRQITSGNPAHDKSPFYDPTGTPMKPVARLTVTRQRVYEKSCDDIIVYATEEPNTRIVAECEVTSWSEMTPCSASCGKGVRMRSRTYISEYKAREHGCVTLLVEKESCEATCIGDVSCETTGWSEWSECSVTCGKGFRSRKRKYKHTKARKLCALSLEEKDHCLAPVAECKNVEVIPDKCSVTNWSEWSPCTASCGRGLKIRTRLHLKPSAHSDRDCNVELQQKAGCTAPKSDCNVDFSEAKEICMKPKEVGPCRGYFPRWYYHATRGMCLQFIYGGCRGNANNFERYTDCAKVCEEMIKDYVRSPLPASAFAYGYYHKDASIHLDRGLVCAPINTLATMPTSSTGEQDNQGPVIDCVVTVWSEWSDCTRTCNSGRRERRRMIKLNPQNGGRPCPKKLVQRRKCKDNPPCPGSVDNNKKAVDCLLSPWGEWSQCTKTCGQNGIRERKRKIKRPAKRGGVTCGQVQEREYCQLPLCY